MSLQGLFLRYIEPRIPVRRSPGGISIFGVCDQAYVAYAGFPWIVDLHVVGTVAEPAAAGHIAVYDDDMTYNSRCRTRN